jgi:hypothetical protein
VPPGSLCKLLSCVTLSSEKTQWEHLSTTNSTKFTAHLICHANGRRQCITLFPSLQLMVIVVKMWLKITLTCACCRLWDLSGDCLWFDVTVDHSFSQ